VPTVDGGVICACAEPTETVKIEAAIIHIAGSTDLMTNPGRRLRRSLTSGQLSTSAWSATTARRFREPRKDETDSC
jgi:metal-dependent HD superfamily phosphatase/phosphodiesterase